MWDFSGRTWAAADLACLRTPIRGRRRQFVFAGLGLSVILPTTPAALLPWELFQVVRLAFLYIGPGGGRLGAGGPLILSVQVEETVRNEYSLAFCQKT